MLRTGNRLRHWGTGLVAVLLLLVGVAVATQPAALSAPPPFALEATDLDRYLRESEAAVAAKQRIIEGAEKRIRWFGETAGDRTSYSVVYLHGFSATRQELAPVAERVADRLAANLFETRLTGHGLEADPLRDARAEDWLTDGIESLAIGARIGERIVLIGQSSGSTLSVALLDQPEFDAVHTLVLLSPNFGPADDAAELLLGPGGPLLARVLVGEYRSWVPANEMQARYWSTRYPSSALVEMMRLVGFARDKLPRSIDQPVLVVYSPQDQVVSVPRIRSALQGISAPAVEVVEWTGSGGPSNHVLAGRILAPENNESLAATIAGFVLNERL